MRSGLGLTRGSGIGQTRGLWARKCTCTSLSTLAGLNCGGQPQQQIRGPGALELTPGSTGEPSTGGDGRGTDGPRPRPQEWSPSAEDRRPHTWRTSPPMQVDRAKVRARGLPHSLCSQQLLWSQQLLPLRAQNTPRSLYRGPAPRGAAWSVRGTPVSVRVQERVRRRVHERAHVHTCSTCIPCTCACVHTPVCVCIHTGVSPHQVAAAKSRQLCPTLCDPIDGSPPGSPVPGILQARTLERVAISFSNA